MCEAALDHITINGKKLTKVEPVQLQPNDRIIFGTGSVFLFRHQDLDHKVQITDTQENPITYEFAMKEKQDLENQAEAARKEDEKRKMEEETAAKMAALHEKMEAEKAQQEAIRRQMQEEYEKKMAALKADVESKKNDEEAKREAEEREAKMRIEL